MYLLSCIFISNKGDQPPLTKDAERGSFPITKYGFLVGGGEQDLLTDRCYSLQIVLVSAR